MTRFTPVFARTAPTVSNFGSVTFVPVSDTEAAAYVTFSNGVPRRIVGGGTAGGIPAHTHSIADVVGLQDSLDSKFSVSTRFSELSTEVARGAARSNLGLEVIDCGTFN